MRYAVWILISATIHGVLFLRLQPILNADRRNAVIDLIVLPKSASSHQTLTRPPMPNDGSKWARRSRSESALPKLREEQLVKNLFSNGLYEPGAAAKAGVSKPLASVNFNSIHEEAFPDNSNEVFHREVYRRIDSHLIFDSLLAQHDHFGTVFLEFKVSEKGFLLSEGLRAQAEDPILKVHAMRAVRRALQEEFNVSCWSLKKSVVFQAKFDFIRGDGDNFTNKQRRFEKALLTFERLTKERRVAKTMGEHLMTGGIHYDPFVVAEKWQKYNQMKLRRAGQFDPFAGYKADPDYNL